MSLKSRFFDAISGDRTYTSQDLAEILARLVTRDGVLYGYAYGLMVLPTSPESLAVRVDLGAAWVQGRYMEVYGGPEQLSVATPDGVYDRIDRVVVRLDLQSTGRTITLAVKQGTPAATPSPPALQRDATIWELSLAQVRVRAGTTSILASDITDERGDTAVCGYTAPATLQATGSGLVAQDSAYSSAVSGFSPTTVKAALDALVNMVSGGRTTVPAARVRHSVNQSIASATDTVLVFDTETLDTDNIYDPASPTRLTCRTPGTYLIAAHFQWTPSQGGYRAGKIRLNGTTVLTENATSASAASYLQNNPFTIYRLNAGDYVEVLGVQDSGSTLYVARSGVYSPVFLMVRLGD